MDWRALDELSKARLGVLALNDAIEQRCKIAHLLGMTRDQPKRIDVVVPAARSLSERPGCGRMAIDHASPVRRD